MALTLPSTHESRAVRFLTTELPGSATRGIGALALFATIQFADAILTWLAVQRYGPMAEGNPLLGFAIVTFGAGAALSVAKLLAICCGTFLHLQSRHLILAILIVIYVYTAILPWSYVLNFYY